MIIGDERKTVGSLQCAVGSKNKLALIKFMRCF